MITILRWLPRVAVLSIHTYAQLPKYSLPKAISNQLSERIPKEVTPGLYNWPGSTQQSDVSSYPASSRYLI